MLTGKALEHVQGNIAQCREAGLDDEAIIRRLEKSGFPESIIKQLITKPAAEKKKQIEVAHQSLEDLVDSLAQFLDQAMPKLWEYHSQGQYESLKELKNYHSRLMEALNESARSNGQSEVYGTDGYVNFRLV